MIKRLCIIGVGLIGGSLARALKQTDPRLTVVGAGRNESSLRRAVELGVIDEYALDARDAVRGADMVVLGVPVGNIGLVLGQIASALSPETIVTDVGSTKGSVVEAARAVFGCVPPRFVPGHPIAGTERSGVEASFPELFRGRRVILTPLPETLPEAAATVRRMWEATGAEVVEMDVQHHDEVLAATSHLPHVLAYTLVDTLAQMEEKREIFAFAAGGFRDFTRIASSDPVMWRDICLANDQAVLAVLERYVSDLAQVSKAIRAGDGDALLDIFARAKTARDRFCD